MKYIINTIILIVAAGLVHSIHAQTNQRYSAPKVNSKHTDFLKRTEKKLLNVDFIVVNAIGEIKKAINEGQESIDGVFDEDSPNVTNSIIVQPGVDADGITIININESDAPAISR